jgi:hypothetical protein
MSAPKILAREWWDSDGLCLQIREGLMESGKIGVVGEDDEVGIAAKLGTAVEHAGLAPHEQGADAVRADRRKDFAYRVRDQVSLRARGRFATASRFPASVVSG